MALHTDGRIYGVSICTGVGMLDRGLELALRLCGREFVPLLYVEREAFAASLLVDSIEKGMLAPAPIWSDVRTVSSDEVSDYLGEATGGEPVDIVFGGIPCQPHSQAGKKLRADDPRDLWGATAEIISRLGPRLVFLENVSGFFSAKEPFAGGGVVFRELGEMGYRATGGLYSSAEMGRIHLRERSFILADSGSERLQGIRADRATKGTVRRGDRESSRLDPLPDVRRLSLYDPSPAPCSRVRVPWDRGYRFRPLPRQSTWETFASGDERVSHGLADRVDRLRAIGNGVDPMVAGFAFLSLAACLGLFGSRKGVTE